MERFPKPGESVRGKLFKTFTGGKGANQAVMGNILWKTFLFNYCILAAKLGADVIFAGRVKFTIR